MNPLLQPNAPPPDPSRGFSDRSWGSPLRHRIPGGRPRSSAGLQRSLFCSCGKGTPAVAGLCRPCYRRQRYSDRFFGGNRELVLRRDGGACRGCGGRQYLNVHHRRAGDHTDLVTLCAGCHARVHRTRFLLRWVPECLVALWREWHPGAPEQLHLAFERPPWPPDGSRGLKFSDFPAREVAEDAAKGDLGAGEGSSRIFLDRQRAFDWTSGASESGGEPARV